MRSDGPAGIGSTKTMTVNEELIKAIHAFGKQYRETLGYSGETRRDDRDWYEKGGYQYQYRTTNGERWEAALTGANHVCPALYALLRAVRAYEAENNVDLDD